MEFDCRCNAMGKWKYSPGGRICSAMQKPMAPAGNEDRRAMHRLQKALSSLRSSKKVQQRLQREASTAGSTVGSMRRRHQVAHAAFFKCKSSWRSMRRGVFTCSASVEGFWTARGVQLRVQQVVAQGIQQVVHQA